MHLSKGQLIDVKGRLKTRQWAAPSLREPLQALEMLGTEHLFHRCPPLLGGCRAAGVAAAYGQAGWCSERKYTNSASVAKSFTPCPPPMPLGSISSRGCSETRGMRPPWRCREKFAARTAGLAAHRPDAPPRRDTADAPTTSLGAPKGNACARAVFSACFRGWRRAITTWPSSNWARSVSSRTNFTVAAYGMSSPNSSARSLRPPLITPWISEERACRWTAEPAQLMRANVRPKYFSTNSRLLSTNSAARPIHPLATATRPATAGTKT
jgi:hypothetical protein